MAYHTFRDEDEKPYGSFETFTAGELGSDPETADLARQAGSGWYWWACFPGCLPDGEPTGPFETEEEAIANAREEG